MSAAGNETQIAPGPNAAGGRRPAGRLVHQSFGGGATLGGGWWQGPESNRGHAASSRAPPALGTRKTARPLPTAGSDVFAAAKALGIGREVAAAFIAYQNFNRWRMIGAVLLDWQKALTGFAKADHERMRRLRTNTLDLDELWAFADVERIEDRTANAWICAMEDRDWRLPNPANGRLEPVHNFKAALRAFAPSDRNLIVA